MFFKIKKKYHLDNIFAKPQFWAEMIV